MDTAGLTNAALVLGCRYGDDQYYGCAVATSHGTNGASTEFVTTKYTDRDGFELLTEGPVPDDLYPEPDYGHTRNHLVVDCRGPRQPSDGDQVTASFTINGKVHKVVDKKSPLANGGVGLIIETLDPAASPGSATLTNLRVAQLPE